MRYLLAVSIVALFATVAHAQTWQRPALAFGFGFTAGAAWGVHEEINHHYPAFQARHPNANPYFWNPEISWETTPVRMGYKFDAKHILASTAQIGCIGGGIVIGIGRRKKWWQYAVDFGSFSAGYILGNQIFYH